MPGTFPRHILEVRQFDRDTVETLFALTDEMRALHAARDATRLRGKILASLFFEPSTRTRLSFESAMMRLGGSVLTAENATESSSWAKGETIEDTARIVESYADAMVIRPPTAGAPAAAAAPEHGLSERILALLDDPFQPGRLDLDFQPIVALQGGEQAQYQTLLRLHAPEGGLIPAGKLLPVVRQAGRPPEFDRWVLARALEVIANRMAMAKSVTLFVNQSVEALCQDDYVAWMAERISGPGQLGESLVIEIDADEIGLDLDRVHAVCTDLVVRGVRFCLSRYRGSEDQDGILHVLPVDLVKVAPDLIAQLGDGERRSAFNQLVDHMHERTVGVIAPRVEDTRTAAVLWMSGIDYIQGNLVQSAGSSLDFDFNSAVL